MEGPFNQPTSGNTRHHEASLHVLAVVSSLAVFKLSAFEYIPFRRPFLRNGNQADSGNEAGGIDQAHSVEHNNTCVPCSFQLSRFTEMFYGLC